MPTPPLSDELAREALQAWIDNGRSQANAAQALGLNFNTFRSRLDKARERGLHLSDGAREIVAKAGLSGNESKFGWIPSFDSEGKKIGNTFWKAPTDQQTDDFLARVRSAFSDMPALPVIPAPMQKAKDLLTLYPIADAHIGMMAWGKETGEDYDTAKAIKRLQSWIGACIEASPPSEQAVILDVGDLTHADDQNNQTPRSKHILDVDTRHFRTLDLTIAALVASVEMALRKHKTVDVRILPGNHNPMSYMAVLFALAERFRDNPRVNVHKEPGEFWAYQFGKVLLSAHHGDKAKAERMVLYLADEHAEMWGSTRHRYLWTGHLHHHKSADIGGVQWEQLRAMTAKDAYATANAYSARAQLQGVTYHRERGEVSRVKVGA